MVGLFSQDVIICKDCKHVAADEIRHKKHMKEPRHVHTYRNLAYREPKKRAMWIKIWFRALEELEEENPWALTFDEEEEEEQMVFITT